MDTTAQSTNPVVPTDQTQPQIPVLPQPVTPGSQDQVQAAQAMPPSAGAGKEVIAIPVKAPEWIQENPPPVDVAPEVLEAGVTEGPKEEVVIPEDVQAAGVMPVGSATPIPETPTLVHLPMTKEKAQGVLKMHKKVKESVTWLAMLIVKQFQQLQFMQNKNKKEVTA